jgi:hypothetical protein
MAKKIRRIKPVYVYRIKTTDGRYCDGADPKVTASLTFTPDISKALVFASPEALRKWAFSFEYDPDGPVWNIVQCAK